jgi:hypothetical protein
MFGRHRPMGGHEHCFVTETQWSHAHRAVDHTAKLRIVVDKAGPGLRARGAHRTPSRRRGVSDTPGPIGTSGRGVSDTA